MTRETGNTGEPERHLFQVDYLLREHIPAALEVAKMGTGRFWEDSDFYKLLKDYPEVLRIDIYPEQELGGVLLCPPVDEAQRYLNESGEFPIGFLMVAPKWQKTRAGLNFRDWLWIHINRHAKAMYVIVPANALEELRFLKSIGFEVPIDPETGKPTIITKEGKEHYKMVYDGT